RRGRRADEGNAVGGQRIGEVGVLGEEAVAGMDGLGAGALAGIDDLLGDQVGLAGGGRAEQHGLVGEADVAGVGVGLGIDGDGADAHAAGGFDHSTSDLPAVGDQNLVEHGDYSASQLGWRLSRKAAMPSRASGVARRWAMRWAVSSTRVWLIGWLSTVRISSLAAAWASGPPWIRASTISWTLASSCSGSTTSWTRPSSRARAASMRSADWK